MVSDFVKNATAVSSSSYISMVDRVAEEIAQKTRCDVILESNRRLHTFSAAIFEQLLRRRGEIEAGIGEDSVDCFFDTGKNSVLIVGEDDDKVQRASQLIVNMTQTEEAKMVPKHPWEEPKTGLVTKSSLPNDGSKKLWLSPPPSHMPILRTVSDSFDQKKRNKSNFCSSRRKLESEDSSYDSDHEIQEAVTYGGVKIPASVTTSRSHEDVSRTPSETLGVEFAEHVTLGRTVPPPQVATHLQPSVRSRETSPGQNIITGRLTPDEVQDLEVIIRDPQYNSKVEFALRLGYSESLLQKALMKLGQNAAQNQILEELIRLQKSKPSEEKDSSSLVHSSSAQELRQPDQKKYSSCEDDLLPIVIDGSNVAMSHGNKSAFSCKGIKICVQWFKSRGHKDITVFVPKWRKEASKPDTPITDQSILTELEEDRLLSFTPSRQVRGRRFVCHDDRYILNLAAETGAIVVSNDNYRDLINEKPEFKKVIEEKILMYSFVNDRFMPPDDPLGRNGPTLNQFLRRSPRPCDVQPCPYGKKCTYGNKCKFFHAERGNLPQKSVTEKLKENSVMRINEVRARGHSRDSSPGDPLMRTKSMQPLHRTSEGNLLTQERQALCRTRSTFPRLSGELLIQPQQQQNIWMNYMPPSMDSDARNAGLWTNNMTMSVGNYSSPPPPKGTICSTLPDTSMPPPPPVAPWGANMCRHPNESLEIGNTHKQLSRQLTINPNFDPRIHPQHTIVHPPNSAPDTDRIPFPPPNHHNIVARNYSAPEQSKSLQTHPNSATPNVLIVPPENQQKKHPVLQKMSSTSDSQLHKTRSDMTLKSSWSEGPTAISPLIGSSDGVWETSTKSTTSVSSDYSEARSKIYYHLAAIFPEDQVLRAMTAMPDETVADKICQYILCLNGQKM